MDSTCSSNTLCSLKISQAISKSTSYGFKLTGKLMRLVTVKLLLRKENKLLHNVLWVCLFFMFCLFFFFCVCVCVFLCDSLCVLFWFCSCCLS